MVLFSKPYVAGAALALGVLPHMIQAQDRTPILLAPATMKRIGTIDERYQSYNIEMLELTGGKFWKPYTEIGKSTGQPAAASGGTTQSGDTPAGMSADLYQYRPPIDFTNPRLRAIAQALGPSYVRISGTWANTTYFADTNVPPKEPPQGYGGVLTRQQWKAAIDFSRAVDAPIVTSMPTGLGTRGADGVWQPDQARRSLTFTKANGGTIAAVEYMNEPTLASMGGAPKGYDAAAYGRDFRVFDAFMRKEYPETKILGSRFRWRGECRLGRRNWWIRRSCGVARSGSCRFDGRRRRFLLPPLRCCFAALCGHGAPN